MMKKHNAETVLKALLMGLTINVGKENFVLDDEMHMCCERTSTNLTTKEKRQVWVRVNFGDTSLAEFIKWAAKIDESDMMAIYANIGLNTKR